MEFIVDFANYPNITLGDFGAPPYTLDQYNKANANWKGIQAIFDQAESLGIGTLIFPRETISIGYSSEKSIANSEALMNFCTNTIYNFTGLTFKVIYDSLNKSPYDASAPTIQPWKFEGCVFSQKDGATNVEVNNLNVIGEIGLRSFTDSGVGFDSEKGREISRAFSTGRYTGSLTFYKCLFDGFMAGGIHGIRGSGGGEYIVGGQTGNAVYNPGYYDEVTDTTIVKAGAYVSPLITLNQTRLNSSWKNYNPFLYIRRTYGFNRTSNLKEDYFDVLFFDTNDVFISRLRTSYMTQFILPKGATKYRLQIFGEDPNLTQFIEANTAQHYMQMPYAGTFIIEDCIIQNCHRGGISNCAEDLTIKNSKFLYNGGNTNSGRPEFPSTTRYHINIEDVLGNNMNIQGCTFIGECYQSVIYGGRSLNINNSRIEGSRIAIGIYSNKNAIISGNTISNCIDALYASDDSAGRSWIRNILFSGNICNVSNSFISRVGEISGRTSIRVVDNSLNVLRSGNFVNMFTALDTSYEVNRILVKEREDFIGIFVQAYKIGGKFIGNTIMYQPVIGSSRFGLLALKPSNDFKDNKLINYQAYPSQSAGDFAEETTITLYNCEFTSIEGSELRNSDLAVASNIPVVSFPKSRLDIRYIDCKFINSRVVLPQFGTLPTTYKEIQYLFSNCIFELIGDVMVGSKPSFIGSNGRGGTTNTTFESYSIEFYKTIFKIDEAVTPNFKVIWTTQTNRDFNIYIDGASNSNRRPLKIGGTVEV